jgi:flagellar hook-length control protein FliK
MTVSLVTPAAPAGPGAKGRGTTSGDSSSAEGFGLVMAQHLATPAEGAAAGRTGKAGTSAATGENAQESEASDGGAEGGSTEVLPHLVLVGTPAALTTPQDEGSGGDRTADGATAQAAAEQAAADQLAAEEGAAAEGLAVDSSLVASDAVEDAPVPAGSTTQAAAAAAGKAAPVTDSAAVSTGNPTAGTGGASNAAAAATGAASNGAGANGATPVDGEGAPSTGAPAASTTAAGATALAGGARSDSGSTRAGTPIPAGMEAVSHSSSATAASEQPNPTAALGTTSTQSTAPAAPASAAAASSGSAVTSQVFPTIPALVSRGEGIHSMTLRLHPADLGEVQVTVTVKNGVVDVTLAAGREAQEAIRSGSHELKSILDLAGSATGQLTIRDLPTGPAPVGSSSASAFSLASSSADTHGEPSGSTDERSSEDRPNGREARGTADGDQAASEPTEPSNARSAAGLDLTL